MKRIVSVLCLIAFAVMLHGQTKIDPTVQINWPRSTGAGAPSGGSCTALNYGAPYTDITNNKPYTCTPGGWVLDGNAGTITGVTAGACLTGGGSSGAILLSAGSAINPQTGTYQVVAADFSQCKTITVGSGTFTITLVASGSQPAAKQQINIINYGSGVVTVAPSGQNINGASGSLTLPAGSATLPTSMTVLSDGTNYFAAIASIASGITNNSLTPATHYVMPTNDLYIASLTTASCNTVSNLSNASGGGLVATTNGVQGTCDINLPQVINPAQPWRVAFLTQVNGDTTNNATVIVSDSGNDFHKGIKYNINGALIGGGWQFSGSQYNQYGFGGGITNPMSYWFTIQSDGQYVWTSGFPVAANVLGFGPTFGSGPAFQAAFDNLVYTFEEPATFTNGGVPLFTNLSKVRIQVTSATNKVIGVYASVGALHGPTDGLFLPPMSLAPKILNDTPGPSAQSQEAAIAVPGTYGSSNKTCLFNIWHANATPAALGYVNANTIYSAVLADNCLLAVMTGDGSGANNYSGPTSSNWNNPAGMVYRDNQIGTIRRLLPATWQLYHFGMSMGCLNALGYEMANKGSAGIMCISGAVNLTGAWTDGAGYQAGLTTVINAAYGPSYVNIFPGTGQTPASSPTTWQPINGYFNAPALGYYDPLYIWPGAYAAGTAYTPNKVVQAAYAGPASAFAPYDPTLNTAVFTASKVPISMYVGSSDTVIPPTDTTNFCTAVGPTCTATTIAGGTHLGSTVFPSPAAVTAFIDTYRSSNPSGNGLTGAPTLPATQALTPAVVTPQVTATKVTPNYIVAGGSQNVSGCSLTAAVGGSSGGSFASGTTGTCTVTITPGLTAPNGWRCSATDLTTAADANNMVQTTTSTTACAIAGTTVSGDIITWQAVAF